MTTQSVPNDDFFAPSRYYAWRCITAMAHADGLVQPEEKAYLLGIFDNMRDRANMPAGYYETLVDDLETPQDALEMLTHVNDPIYRSQVVYFARLLCYKDGVLAPSEEEMLKKLHDAITDNLDIENIRETVRTNVQKELLLHSIKIDESRPDDTMFNLFKLLDEWALYFGIDLMAE